MPDVRTSITVAAPPDRVWSVLTDFAAYSQWNSVLSRVRADLRVGGSFRFKIRVEGAPELPFNARIVCCEPARELRWRGGAPLIPALAWGEHYFQLTPADVGTLVTHGEHFGGLLALLMRGSTHARLTRTYERFNQALKARAESGL